MLVASFSGCRPDFLTSALVMVDALGRVSACALLRCMPSELGAWVGSIRAYRLKHKCRNFVVADGGHLSDV